MITPDHSGNTGRTRTDQQSRAADLPVRDASAYAAEHDVLVPAHLVLVSSLLLCGLIAVLLCVG